MDETEQYVIREAWERFTTRHELSPIVRPLIAQSWMRCWPRLSAQNEAPLKRLTSDHLLSTQVANFELLSIARPIMEDIYQFVDDSETAILLVNTASYVMDILGDPSMLEFVSQHGIGNGSLMAETEMGTNALALSIQERIPAKVIGCEHFRRSFHRLAEAAAPIFDWNGHPLGALGVINHLRDCHSHNLGLVVAGARAIEGQRQADQLLGEQNSQLARLNTILATIREGILVWNWDGILIHANLSATHILGLELEALKGRPIEDEIQLPSFIKSAIQNKHSLTDVEAGLIVGGRRIECIFSLRCVRGSKDDQWIIATLRRAQEVRQLVHQQVGARATYTLDNLIGRSAEFHRIYRQAKTAAAARASLVIRGESGTGKSVLAHAIHHQSPHGDGPFIIVSCASIPSELIVSELLGYEGEPYSREGLSRPSKFELAEGGTIFFQDVDALPLEAQAILLNVLELGILQRLGSRRPIEVRVRIIASTSQSLTERTVEGNFRADLYYRLSAFEIFLPPLRERKSDIALLANQTLLRLSRLNQSPSRLSKEALDLLENYHWPGNIRELESVLERAVLHARDQEILPRHLPDYIRRPEAWVATEQGLRKTTSMNELEREAILQTARLCKGNVSRMAKVLGIGRTTLWRRLKKWDISINEFRPHSM